MYDKNKIKPWASFGDTFENKPYIHKQMVMNWGNDGKTWDDWAGTAAIYYGMISQIDDSTGIILDALESSGRADETMVIFTSDHGDTCGGHGMFDKHYTLYDDVCRVPLIVRYPRPGGKGGLVCNDFVSNMLDIAPTIEELCGIEPRNVRHGISLVPLLKGEAQPERDGFAVSSSNGQQFGFFCNRSIRDGRWRYVWNLTDIDELYDHENDEGEMINLAGDPKYSDVLKDLRIKLHRKLTGYGDPFAAGGWVSRQLTEGRKI
jgi:arylsulfatase A-like enzyme